MAEVDDASSAAAIPAASVLVLRDGPLEVLMLHRRADASFVPDAWVFPGGAVEDDDAALGDGTTLATMRIAAARELFEETGVWLGAPLDDADAKRHALLAGSLTFRELVASSPIAFEQLVWTSHWITPFGVPKRFDTYFFLARVARDVVATAQASEAVDVVWIAPADALARRKELRLVFPTIRNLEAIAGFTSAEALIESRRGADIQPVQPRIVDGRITLP
jgi:8-oxo-dGTP pyrophosphatase MutT (NUDIX family)